MERLKEEKGPEVTRDEPVFSGDLPLGFLSPTDKPGQLGRLERYEVIQEIGRGGMGVVLKAFDPSLHRVVAIKVLAPQLATSGVARKRFLREAKAAAAVTHDHIVTIHAVDEANGLPYLVMQYIAGMSLQDRIDKDGPLELADVLRIGMQTASGLAAAHGQGIVHRDIKPANILLEEGVQRVKITDFGLARAMDDASLTQSGFVAGSPLYMAPEQARGEALDQRADLFSLGSVLYTMCTGRPPFRAANTLAVLRRVSEDAPRPIRETNPEFPEWLAAVVDKLMAKDPSDRYQSAAEVVDVLGQHLAQHQHAGWVPPPAAANVNAGLPTSVTLCPSCGASLHVAESMVGNLVHCPECGKPFHVEEGSEVIQVARSIKPPLGPRFRARKAPPARFWLICGCAALLFLMLLLGLLYLRMESQRPAAAHVSERPVPAKMEGTQRKPEPFWKSQLSWLPAEATLFGAFDLTATEALTLDDARTHILLNLLLPAETADKLTPENLGRIRIDGLSLAYYAGTKPEDARAIVHFEGLALDGHKRIVDFIRQTPAGKMWVEENNTTRSGSKPIRITGSELPYALGFYDDNHAFLAVSAHRDAKESEHLKALRQLPQFDFPDGPLPFSPDGPRSFSNILSGYNPPWIHAALNEVSPNAFGLVLGEVPTELRKLLTKALGLRVAPRTFICQLRKDGQDISLGLTLSVDKAGAEQLLLEDLEKWRRQGLDALQTKLPALKNEPEALALVRQTLQTMRWGANPGSRTVRTRVQIPGPTWKALVQLLKVASPAR